MVVAAITSCTNTSNPQVMVAAGLLAQRAVDRGLRSKPWVKTSLAPGSRVVMDYLDRAGLTEPLDADRLRPGRLRVHHLHRQLRAPARRGVRGGRTPATSRSSSVLSGNRNFEGRIHPDVRMNYLASPPLVVAYALAGTMDIDLTTEPLGTGRRRRSRSSLADLWPTAEEVTETIRSSLDSRHVPHALRLGLRRRRALAVRSTVADGRHLRVGRDTPPTCCGPPFLDGWPMSRPRSTDIDGARVLAMLGTASPPTTSRRPAASARPPRPGAT